MALELTKDEMDALWSKVTIVSPAECWNWTAYRDAFGYGRWAFRRDKKQTGVRAHRIIYELCFGSIPPGLVVRHSCDNPSCCNPAHLQIGTQKDNVADRDSRGRTARGEAINARRRIARGEVHGRAKLSEADVIAIRADQRNKSAIARAFGVGRTTVRNIKAGILWSHV